MSNTGDDGHNGLPGGATPSPGWYANPEVPGGHRWWDGEQWTSHLLEDASEPSSAAQQPTPPNGLRPVGPWLSSVMDVIRARAGHLFTLFAVISVPTAIVSGLLAWQAIDGVVITGVDSGELGVDGFSASSIYFWAGSFAISSLASLILGAAIVHQAAHAKAESPQPWSESLVHAGRRLPRIIGVALGFLLALMLLSVGASIVIAVLGALSPATLLISLPVVVAALLYLGVRFSLVFTGAAAAPVGVSSFGSSWKLTGGVFWPILGRLAMLVVCAFGVQMAGGILSAPFTGGLGGTTIDSETTELVVSELMGAGNPATFLISQVIGSLLGGLTASLWGIGLFAIYRARGGEIAPELRPEPGAAQIDGMHPGFSN